MKKKPSLTWLTAALTAIVVATAGCAGDQANKTLDHEAVSPKATQGLRRPANLAHWPVVGTTIRMSPSEPHLPKEFREVRVEPSNYAQLLRDGHFRDGAQLAVTFRAAKPDNSQTPSLYSQDRETFTAIEVIDHAQADGRRFYTFRPGDDIGKRLPVGNACAACHNAQGSLQGTFVQHYPALAPFGSTATKAQSQ